MDLDLCTKCKKPVEAYHFAIECDCNNWTHIGCGTGYLKKTYTNAVQGMYIQLCKTIKYNFEHCERSSSRNNYSITFT